MEEIRLDDFWALQTLNERGRRVDDVTIPWPVALAEYSELATKLIEITADVWDLAEWAELDMPHLEFIDLTDVQYTAFWEWEVV